MSDNSTSPSSSISSAAPGVIGAYDGDSFALKAIIVLFASLAMYNAVELLVLVFMTFSRYRGLYFWSLVISSLGLIPYGLGFLFKFFNILTGNARWVSVALFTLGWYPMITGQSVILWSRLHLIVSGERGRKILKYTKWMIIVDAIILHISTSVVTFGSNGTLNTAIFVEAYNIVEKIQMIGFFLQEAILSTIYIVETIRILRTSLQAQTRRLMLELVFINVVIIIMDMALVSMECASLYLLEAMTKGVLYSIKLKLEFAILSRLVKFVGGAHRNSNVTSRGGTTFYDDSVNIPRGMERDNENDVSEFVDITKIATDVTHASPAPKRNLSGAYVDDLDIEFARFEHIESANLEDGSEKGNEDSQNAECKV